MSKSIFTLLFTASILFSSNAQINLQETPTGEHFELKADHRADNYRILVTLPRGYEKEDRKYPCLYLFYGDVNKVQAASGLVNMLYLSGQIPPVIVVGVTNMNWGLDLTPIPVEGRKESGGADAYHNFVTQDLFKVVDERYKTSDRRIMMGHSFGGLFGVHCFMKNPNDFDDYLLLSPSISKRADYLETAFKKKITSDTSLKNQFYYSVGSESTRIMRGALWLYDGLNAANENIRWQFELVEGTNHGSVVPISFMNGLKFIFEEQE
ncbi:MAG: alpha/beta hydrolase-fold protein [Bacteroidota bacterium]